MHLPPARERLAFLDAYRGLAALAVALLYHFEHFSGTFQPGALPFAAAPGYGWPLLSLAYEKGFLAVDFFFIISGCVFQHVYGEAVAKGAVDARTFFVHRVSRLYPVHLVTLLATLVLMTAFHALTGRFPLHQHNNDLYHLGLNLLFLQKGFFDAGMSFNAPSWSLSVEAFLYLVFFVLIVRRAPLLAFAALALLGLAMGRLQLHHTFLLNVEIGRGLFGFCWGVILAQWLATPRGPMLAALAAASMLAGVSVLGRLLHIGVTDLQAASLFTLLIAAPFVLPPLRHALERPALVWLGDRSLAVYLVHLPVQMAILLALVALGLPIPVDKPWFMALYAALILTAAGILHTRLERPAQSWLRSALKGRRAVAVA
ncbi:MAG: acyltransferase [Geminicoccaceae bacterium]